MADGEVKATRQRELLVIGDELASKDVRLAAAATQMRTLIESNIFNGALRDLGAAFKYTDNPEDLERALGDWGILFSRLSNIKKVKRGAVDQLRREIGGVLSALEIKMKRALPNMHGLISPPPPQPRRMGILEKIAQMKVQSAQNDSSENLNEASPPQPEAQEINPEGNVVASNVESGEDGALSPDASSAPSDANLVAPVEEVPEIKNPEIAVKTGSNLHSEGNTKAAIVEPEAETQAEVTPQEANPSENIPGLEAKSELSAQTEEPPSESQSETPKKPLSKKPSSKKSKGDKPGPKAPKKGRKGDKPDKTGSHQGYDDWSLRPPANIAF